MGWEIYPPTRAGPGYLLSGDLLLRGAVLSYYHLRSLPSWLAPRAEQRTTHTVFTCTSCGAAHHAYTVIILLRIVRNNASRVDSKICSSKKGVLQGSPKGPSRVHQGSHKGRPQGSLQGKCPPRVLRGSSKGLSRVTQASLKGSPKVPRGSSKGLPKVPPRLPKGPPSRHGTAFWSDYCKSDRRGPDSGPRIVWFRTRVLAAALRLALLHIPRC